jgi:RNA polymerase sigma-70 factor (ECF subfamily)
MKNKMSFDDAVESFIQTGENFDIIYKQIYPRLSNFIYSYINTRDGIPEIISNTVMRVLTSRKKYNSEKSELVTWIYNIAKNECKTYLNKKKRDNLKTEIDENIFFNNNEFETSNDIIDREIKLQKVVKDVLNEIKVMNIENAYQIYYYKFFEKKSHKEIVNILNEKYINEYNQLKEKYNNEKDYYKKILYKNELNNYRTKYLKNETYIKHVLEKTKQQIRKKFKYKNMSEILNVL